MPFPSGQKTLKWSIMHLHCKKYSKNLKTVIPVVAQAFRLNDTAYAPPDGITELIDATNALLSEGVQAAQAEI